MEMSRKIYLLRTENNLTQSELAKIAGATDKAVSSWEKGTRSPKLQYTRPICEHFGIDLNAFIDESNDIYKAGVPSNNLSAGLNVSLDYLIDENDTPHPNKNAPSISDEAMKLAKDYDALDNWGQQAIRDLADTELNRKKLCGPARPMVQAAARGGGVHQIEYIPPEELPVEKKPIP